eukprot:scaffold9944_cov84-Skeletonema_marinoi.AAC.1
MMWTGRRSYGRAGAGGRQFSFWKILLDRSSPGRRMDNKGDDRTSDRIFVCGVYDTKMLYYGMLDGNL